MTSSKSGFAKFFVNDKRMKEKHTFILYLLVSPKNCCYLHRFYILCILWDLLRDIDFNF